MKLYKKKKKFLKIFSFLAKKYFIVLDIKILLIFNFTFYKKIFIFL
jgi:hypothetical protein